MNVRNGLRRLVGTLCGACIVTLVALCFSAAPARAQTGVATCVVVALQQSSPVLQGSTAQLAVTARVVADPSLSCSQQSRIINVGSDTLFASAKSVNSTIVQTSCGDPLGSPTDLITTVPVAPNPFIFNPPTLIDLDTSTVGTFGYEVSYSGEQFVFDPSTSPCIDLVVTAPTTCTGPVSIAADLASGPGMPLAGTTDQWTVQLHIHACQDITALKVQGGTNGWATNVIGSNPSVGTASVKQNNKNQVITWLINELGQGTTDATLLIDITGTIKPDTTPGTILGLLGSWSLVYTLADGVQQKTTPTGVVTVQVMPPL